MCIRLLRRPCTCVSQHICTLLRLQAQVCNTVCASVYRRYLYHQRSPPWCCHILTFAMTEKVSSRSHSGRPGVGVAPVLLPSRWKYPSSIAYYLPTYSSCEHYRLAAYMRSRLGDPSRSHKLNGRCGCRHPIDLVTRSIHQGSRHHTQPYLYDCGLANMDEQLIRMAQIIDNNVKGKSIERIKYCHFEPFR